MKEIITTVTRRGQVTIPAEARQLLKLKPGDKVAYTIRRLSLAELPPESQERLVRRIIREIQGIGQLDYQQHIISNPNICHGSPCIKGTRIPVSIILDLLATGTTYEEIGREYPPVTEDDIRACLLFAAELADYTVVDLSER